MPGWMMELGDGTAIDVRGILVEVIKYHTVYEVTAWPDGRREWGCMCAWGGVSKDAFAEHVADVFEESVEARLLDQEPIGPEQFYGELKATLGRATEDCDGRGFPKSLCDRFRAAADVCDRAAGDADSA